MKDSGIAWIGDIPERWEVVKVKYLATEKDSLFIDGDWIESEIIEEQGIRYLTTGNVGAGYYKRQGSGYISEKTFHELQCLKVYPNDLMISRLNEPIGRACIVPNDEDYYVVAVDNVILRPNKNYDKKFIMYAMNTDGYAEHGSIVARGATMARVSRSQLGQFWITYPNTTEQTLIVNYLDTQCTKIDSVISDIEKQIELLQKYEKSLITETVTKGLDKNVPMKDSGVEWIGEIPEGWEVKKIKYLATLKGRIGWQGLTSDEYIEEGPYLITGVDFDNGKINWDNCVHVSKERWEEASEIQIKNDDLLITKDGTVGKVAIVSGLNEYASLNSGVLLIRTNKNFDRKFLFWVLQSEEFWTWFRLKNAGNSTIIHLYQNDFTEFCYTYSNLAEQQAIANYLDIQCSKIDSIIESKKEQLSKINDYKKSHIYEYVTGKKRVEGVCENGN